MQGLEELKKLLRERVGFDVIDGSSTDGQVRLIGRVPPNAGSYWILIVHKLLVTCEQTPWKVDISRMYFVRKLASGSKIYYAWRLIFQAPRIEQHLREIFTVIRDTPRPSHVELKEFPLSGTAHRNQHVNGKGAGSVDRVPLGPMAVAAAMQQRVRG